MTPSDHREQTAEDTRVARRDRATYISRRSFVQTAAVAATPPVALSGCLHEDATYNEATYADEEFVDDTPEYDGYLDDVDHPGMVDWTGRSDVTVLVGDGENGLHFGPAAIRIDRSTTVTWEWTGSGGGHDVVEEDGAFESTISYVEGHTFSHEFDEPGLYRYTCQPHDHRGMRGAIEVV